MPYADPEKQKQNSKEYAQKNRDKINAYHREYYAKNSKRYKHIRAIYYENNKEEYAKRSKEWYNNPNNTLKRREKIHGISLEIILTEQQGICPICLESIMDCDISNIHIDHDHITGFVRGILHRGCNVGLGMFSDSVETLYRAITYLENGRINRYGISKAKNRSVLR